jgi:putative effector of murein hydrolase
MNKVLIILISLISFFCANQQVYAQLDSLSNGNRIRITATKYFLQPTIATFEKLHSDSLFFNINNRTLAIPINLIKKLEVSKKQKQNTITGIIVGSLTGGVVLGIAMHSEEQKAEGFGKVGQPGFWGGFASGALLGGGVGALIGSQIKSDKWKQIYIGRK